jgi:hypothetical protein
VLPLLLLGGLSVDILYLYYAGSWIEPNTFIRVCELVMLWALIPMSIGLAIRAISKG